MSNISGVTMLRDQLICWWKKSKRYEIEDMNAFWQGRIVEGMNICPVQYVSCTKCYFNFTNPLRVQTPLFGVVVQDDISKFVKGLATEYLRAR